MKLALVPIVVTSITSLFVFKLDKSFDLLIYDSLEQETARLGTDHARPGE